MLSVRALIYCLVILSAISPVLDVDMMFFLAEIDEKATASSSSLVDSASETARCEQHFDFVKFFYTMNSYFSRDSKDSKGGWIEYAMVKNKVWSGNDVLRVSFSKKVKSGDEAWLEVWFDRLGESAVRIVQKSDGTIEYLMKSGKRIYNIPQDNTKGRCAKSTMIDEILKKFQSGISSKSESGTQVVNVIGGSFDCYQVDYIDKDRNAKIYFSEKIPLLGVAKVDFGHDTTMEMVSYGEQVYSVFPKDSVAIPLKTFIDTLSSISLNMNDRDDSTAVVKKNEKNVDETVLKETK